MNAPDTVFCTGSLWSYAIYLLHVPLLPVFDLRETGLALFGLPGYWAATACCYAFIVAMAALTYRHIEIPAKHRLLGRRRAAG